MLTQVFVNLARGSPDHPSIIGIHECGAMSWSILAFYMLFLISVTAYNMNQIKREQTLKERFDGTLILKSDVSAHGKDKYWIALGAFLASCIGNMLGLGGGFLFNPV